MGKDELIGIYKFLSSDEELIYENKSLSTVILVKEAFIKKVLKRTERKEMAISFSKAKTFLTNKRLIFLILYQKYSRVFDDQNDSTALSGIEGTWFEIPVWAISDYDIRRLKYKDNMWKDDEELLYQITEGELDKQSLLEIIYDEKQAAGRSLEYVEGMMRRGRISKWLGKVDQISDKVFILGSDATTLAPSLKQFVNKEVTRDDIVDAFFCNKCGAKQTDQESKFCNKCGSTIQPPIQ